MSNLVGLGSVGIGTMTPQCALDVNGNVNVSGTIVSANTNMMFRNRIINGDMRLDQTRLGSNVQAGNIAASVANITSSLDRFQMSTGPASSMLAAKQVTLPAADQLAIGNISAKAVAISPSVQPDITFGLTTLITFEGSNAVDTLGGVAGPTWTGTPTFVTGKIGTTALNLSANTPQNNLGSATVGVQYTVASFTPNSTTFAFWVNVPTYNSAGTMMVLSGTSNAVEVCISSNTTTFGVYAQINGGTAFSPSSSVSSCPQITPGTWNHIAVTVSINYITLYVNGVQQTPASYSSVSALSTIALGSRYNGAYVFSGYVDDFRIYNRALAPQDVAALYNYNGTSIPMAVTSSLNTGLVTHLTFEGNSIQDVAGGAGSATWYGTPQFTTGKVGSTALYLNNTSGTPNNYLTYTNSFAMTQIPWTWSVWVNVTNCSNTGELFSWSSGIPTGAVNMNIDTSSTGGTATAFNMYLALSGQWTISMNTGTIINYGVWYHIAVTVTSAFLVTMYVNGTQVNQATGNGYMPATNSSYLLVGKNGDNNLRGLYGAIDDLRLYNRALSASEVAALAGNTAVVTIPNTLSVPASMPTSGLVSYFTFEGSLADSQSVNTLSMAAGTAQYVGGRIGNQALYLANEGNVSANTKAANYAQIASYNCSASTSVSCWFYFTSTSPTGNQSEIWEFGPIGGTEILQLLTQNPSGTMILYPWAGNGEFKNGLPIVAGTWYHAVVTFVPSTSLSLYVNGILINTLTSSIGAGGSGAFRIGESTTYTRPFAGYIDDLRIYNTTLTPAQINTLFYAGQPNAYALYQQPIEAQTLTDFAWGTSNAQSASVSAWIKNNTPAAQQFALALNTNPGLTTWITFENGSATDVMGNFSGPAMIGTLALSSSTFKVGSSALNLTANTAGATTQAVAATYTPLNTNTPINPPITIAFWANCSNFGPANIPVYLGSASSNGFAYQVVWASGVLYVSALLGGSDYYTNPTSNSFAPNTNTWYHICSTISYNNYHILYVNGVQVSQSFNPLPASSVFSNITMMRFGGQSYSTGNNAFQGYIDDFRIYNTALTQPQVYQLYINNANSTTLTSYLLPRSLVYNTPSIPSTAWQKVAFTVPGDSFGTYATDTSKTLTLSLCLGAGTTVSTSNVALTSGNTSNVWSTGLYYSGSNIQTYGTSSNNFMANPYNSVYLTGLQMEKGTLVTPFECRNYGVERTTASTLANSDGTYNVGLGTAMPSGPLHVAAASNSSALVVMPSSYVGIGTNAPAANLHVVGNEIVTGNMNILGSNVVCGSTSMGITFSGSSPSLIVSNLSFNSTNYNLYQITSGCTMTVTQPIQCMILLVGGGGGGSGGGGAGGGGGGVVVYGAGTNNGAIAYNSSAYTFSPGVYTVTIGGGGGPGYNNSNAGNGSSTSILNGSIGPTIAVGGGGGGSGPTNNGNNGGCGGGGTNGGYPGMGSQGFNGGKGGIGGGGGGGGGPGGIGDYGPPGNGYGGAGYTWTVGSYSVSVAGGGGGGGLNVPGGVGGGGSGNYWGYSGNPGTANTGGGGGGTNDIWGGSRIAYGGSGVIYIAIPTSSTNTNLIVNGSITMTGSQLNNYGLPIMGWEGPFMREPLGYWGSYNWEGIYGGLNGGVSMWAYNGTGRNNDSYNYGVWNARYMLQFSSLSMLNGLPNTGHNYCGATIRVDNSTHNQVFMQVITCDRWTNVNAFVMSGNTPVFPLFVQSNSTNASNNNTNSSRLGPNNRHAQPVRYHEWISWLIPVEAVKAYSYSNNQLLNVGFCSGVSSGASDIWISGMWCNPNPYGNHYQSAVDLQWGSITSNIWGDAALIADNGCWNEEYLTRMDANTSRTIRIPIPGAMLNSGSDLIIGIIYYNDTWYTSEGRLMFGYSPGYDHFEFSPVTIGRYGQGVHRNLYRRAHGAVIPFNIWSNNITSWNSAYIVVATLNNNPGWNPVLLRGIYSEFVKPYYA